MSQYLFAVFWSGLERKYEKDKMKRKKRKIIDIIEKNRIKMKNKYIIFSFLFYAHWEFGRIILRLKSQKMLLLFTNIFSRQF